MIIRPPTKKILLYSFLTLLSIGSVLKISYKSLHQAPYFDFPLPRHAIESWTFGSFESFTYGEPLYQSVERFKSPIYMSLPYQTNFIASQALSAMSGLPLVGANRLLNVLYGLGILLSLILTLRSLLHGFWIALICTLPVFPLVWETLHIGYAFPHEMTKLFLGAWLAFICHELISGTSHPRTAIVLACLAPFVRQTFVFLAIFQLAVYLPPLLRKGWTSTLRAVLPAALTSVAGLALLFWKSAPQDVIFWILQLPSRHPKGLQLIPPDTLRIANICLAVGLFLVFLRRKDIQQPRRMALLALLAYFTCLFHAAKMGSGNHMTDSIVYTTIILLALQTGHLLRSFRPGWLHLAVTSILLLAANRGLHNQDVLLNPFTHFRAIVSDNHSVKTRLAKERAEILGFGPALSFFGEIPGAQNLQSGPWASSLIDTSYSQPRYDPLYWPQFQNLPQPQWVLLAHANLLAPLLPTTCRIEETKTFELSGLTFWKLNCPIP